MPHATTGKFQFTDAAEIHQQLRSQSLEALTRALTTLRNQFSIKPDETTISATDKRLSLAQQWLEQSPGAQVIFGLWETAGSGQTSLISLLLSVLSSVLNLLSSHYTFHTLGYPIIKSLLTAQWTRKLNSYIGGSNNDLILSTLKLFNSISAFASGRERKNLLDSIAWEAKSLPKLLNMRRRTKGGETADLLVKPDIRTLYIFLLLSFISPGTLLQVKVSFLEQQKMKFLAIFKGLLHDPYSVVRRVLEVCWAGIWSDVKLKRTMKIGLFNEVTIDQLAKLYDRTEPEDEDPDQIPADLVHHFLLAICTRPGVGICFKDRGWYPREMDNSDLSVDKDNDDLHQQRHDKVYNRMLANVLKVLKANEDLRQQELAVKILTACPELVAGYWASAALTLEPRLSSKWIANISLFGTIVSLPVSTSSFLVDDTKSDLYNPTPPPLSNIIENILPSVSVRNLAKGLSPNAAGLVQHCTAIALAKCLTKYHEVSACFRNISASLGESEEEGQWCKRRKDLEREMRKRVPAFEVIVSFSQHREGADSTKAAMLGECATRLLWLYHECLPELVLQSTFDVGKLLVNLFEEDAGQDDAMSAAKLRKVERLHVYRLLKSNEQFVWGAKPSSFKNTYLGLLLKAYARSKMFATQQTLASLLEYLLTNSILFEEVPEEPSLWLASLPVTKRLPNGAESPDGAPLTDELEGVVNFLDECIQRCLKTTHRYIDEMHSFSKVSSSSDADEDIQYDKHPNQRPSPLMMTILEQFSIMVVKKLLTPSDTLALVTFVRMLLLKLTTSLQELPFLQLFARRLGSTVVKENLFPQYPIITAAILREVQTIFFCVGLPSESAQHADMDGDSSLQVREFIDEVEKLTPPAEPSARAILAYELVDWIRFLNDPIYVHEIRRLAASISRLYGPSISFLCQSLPPQPTLIWEGIDVHEQKPSFLDFSWLFINTDENRLGDERCRSILVQTALSVNPTLPTFKRFIRVITRRLTNASETCVMNLILLVQAILEKSQAVLSANEFLGLKEFIFIRCLSMKHLCMSISEGEPLYKVLAALVRKTLDPTDTRERAAVQEITYHWAHVIKTSLETPPNVPVLAISTWIDYIPPEELLHIFDLLESHVTNQTDSSAFHLLEKVVYALNLSRQCIESDLRWRLPRLLHLHSLLPAPAILQDMIGSTLDWYSPICLDGLPLDNDHHTFETTLSHAELRWQGRLERLPSELSLQSFLEQESWSKATVKIIGHILRSQPPSHALFSSWLQSEHCSRHPIHLLAPVLRSYLEVARALKDQIPTEDISAWTQYFPNLIRILEQSVEMRDTAAACVSMMFSVMSTKQSDLVASLIKHVEKLPTSSFTAQLLDLALQLHSSSSDESQSFIENLAHYGLQWVVRELSDEGTPETMDIIKLLGRVLELSPNLKPHVVEPFLTFVIQSHLANVEAMKLLSITLEHVHLKPLVVNRYLQSIVQHPQFFKVGAVNGRYRPRAACIHALHTIFNLHPANTSQVSHVELLIRLYGGTVSVPDRQLLEIFRLFEEQRKTSISALFAQWNASPDLTSHSSLEALQSLNPALVLRTTVRFSTRRSLDTPESDTIKAEQDLYDPLFLILLFAQAMEENTPDTATGWVEVFRTNIVGLLIRTLSARDSDLRGLALGQISRLWARLEQADLQEKPHVMHILSLLKDSIPKPSMDEPLVRLPTYITLLLAHSLRCIFSPSNFMYPITARFLLQRPKLDLQDVPLLYSLLYSSSDDWKKERTWIIRYLADGLVSENDWRVFKRRHTWDLLASMFQSNKSDRALRKGIFEVLANLTCIRQATTSLILKSGLLSWIEMQVQLFDFKDEDVLSWLKIMENIICIVDVQKMENATLGDWRSVIGRCLSLLIKKADSTQLSALVVAARLVLRLSTLPATLQPNFKPVLGDVVRYLRRCETNDSLAFKPITDVKDAVPLPPHTSSTLHDAHDSSDPLCDWGTSVEFLWQAVMQLDDRTQVWDALTSRLLIWRAVVGPDRSSVADWVAREALLAHVEGVDDMVL